jgi:carotenoid biosynthesis protein
MSKPAPPKQSLPFVQSGVQSDYFIKTKFLGEISVEKYIAFCPYRIDRLLPCAGKTLLARAIDCIRLCGSKNRNAGALPPLIAIALITLLPFVFVFVHGSVNYRFRDMLVFAAITLVVSNIFENMSILTGFPFGHYYYTDGLGYSLPRDDFEACS